MITLTDSIEVEAAPEKVFEWLAQRFKDKEGYQAWHPDHVDVRWIKGEPLQEGSIICAEEYLHGQLHKLKFVITEIVPNKEIKYKFLFPWSIVAPGDKFLIEPKGRRGCIFTATVSFRGGPLFEKLLKDIIEAIKRHMKEEGENLKKALERKEKG
jgi:uncharacterized protein YndB with AHSA1/START domain